MKKVLITGITGQDGSLMADYLLNNFDDIEVYGAHRRLSVPNHENIKHLVGNSRFKKIEINVADQFSVNSAIMSVRPDYYINFAANSFVGNSWNSPVEHMESNAMGVINALQAIKDYVPECKFYNAGSSEQFGDVDYWPQDIKHPFKPRSPYGISKCAAHHIVKVWRESYGLFAVQGILFNHEGVRRGEEFVTRKITKNVARISNSIKQREKFEPLKLGNIYAKRDWSDAEDFVKGVWLMLNQEKPKDYILSSNETHSIKEFIELAFQEVNISGYWMGDGIDEKYVIQNFEANIADLKDLVLVSIDKKFYRPAEVELLLGDSNPAREELGWAPQTSFKELVKKMVAVDVNAM
jgi:GDPmannose 4,6-dehydratase